MRAFHQGSVFFESARSGPDCPPWIKIFYRPYCRPKSPRKSDHLLFLNMPIKNRHPVVVRGSGEGRVLTLRWHYVRPSVESGRGYTKAPEGDQFFRYPTLGGLRVIASDLPPKVWGSAGQCSPVLDYFLKNAADRPKKRIGYYRNQNNPWWNGRFIHTPG